jgi:TPR repeat protein
MPKTAGAATARFAAAGCMLLTGALLAAAPAARAGSFGYYPDYYYSGFIAGYTDDAGVKRVIERAKRGNAHAQAVLGFMYANGRGVPQSYDLAVDWYGRAAEQGDADGQYLLGLMYDKGFGVNMDVVMAHKWLNLAAAHAPPHMREAFLKMRDAVGTKMTRAQIDLAHKLAVDFLPHRE